MSTQVFIIYVEAWLTVGVAVFAAGLCFWNAYRIPNVMRRLRVLCGAVCLGIAVVYVVALVQFVSTLIFFNLMLPGYLSLIAIVAARELARLNNP